LNVPSVFPFSLFRHFQAPGSSIVAAAERRLNHEFAVVQLASERAPAAFVAPPARKVHNRVTEILTFAVFVLRREQFEPRYRLGFVLDANAIAILEWVPSWLPVGMALDRAPAASSMAIPQRGPGGVIPSLDRCSPGRRYDLPGRPRTTAESRRENAAQAPIFIRSQIADPWAQRAAASLVSPALVRYIQVDITRFGERRNEN